MNALASSDGSEFRSIAQSDLLGRGFDQLRGFAKSLNKLRQSLETLKDIGDDNVARRVDRMLRQLEQFEPSVTMIGQIKSGKTSLVNAMIGTPDLLPVDVNPWTSVVTSLHLRPEADGSENTASFQFFDEDEWEKLISGGGRIGELASRAGADQELEKIKQQVADMREKSRARLGRKFEVMLGQRREYGYIDRELIERYVCLGNQPEGEDVGEDVQGRFADITKSADLNIKLAALPIRLCLRDTPGVNDTFMMREQITIRALRDSRICVVVLSAHQALSSSDMALIRLISHVKSRDVVIFVNRIDELSDPVAQVVQIRTSIVKTLKKHKGPQDANIIFGSALWATYALKQKQNDLPPASVQALEAWAGIEANQSRSALANAWQLSGIPQLHFTIAERIVEGAGSAILQRIASSAKNLATGLVAAEHIMLSDGSDGSFHAMNYGDARAEFQAICLKHKKAFEAEFAEMLDEFSGRMERVQHSFLDRATASLIQHLESSGDISRWTYDPAGLRILLNSSHKVLSRNSQSKFENATRDAALEISGLYRSAYGLLPEDISITLPNAPHVPPPVTLGRTIALDLGGSWWKRWWMQRRGYKAFTSDFYDLIKSETNPIIAELRDDLAHSVQQEALAAFDAFLSEQMLVFDTLDHLDRANPKELQDFIRKSAPQDRRQLLQHTLETLSAYA